MPKTSSLSIYLLSSSCLFDITGVFLIRLVGVFPGHNFLIQMSLIKTMSKPWIWSLYNLKTVYNSLTVHK